MKHTITGWLLLTLLWGASACKDDFLDRQPLDVLSTVGNLASTNELRLYMNQFYQNLPSHPDALNNFYDSNSDNMLATNINTRLDGKLAVSNATRITEYNTIRGINYFLANYKNATGSQTTINQYVGEARFFRAWFYFEMVKQYGDVTWVNQVLPLDQEVMQVPRDPRTMVVDSILADLTVAADLLPVQANSASLRIHRDVALTLQIAGGPQRRHLAKVPQGQRRCVLHEVHHRCQNQGVSDAGKNVGAGRDDRRAVGRLHHGQSAGRLWQPVFCA